MGLAKSELIEAQERGWSGVDRFVCADCVEDASLKGLIEGSAQVYQCDYCGRSSIEPIAAPVDVLLGTIFEVVAAYFHEPADAGVPWDRGYLVDALDFGDVLDRLGFDGHPELMGDVVGAEANGGYWVPAADGHWATAHDHEVMRDSWASFSHAVKHETRFHFYQTGSSEGQEIAARDMLSALGERLKPLVKRLDAGQSVYRVRKRRRDETWEPTAKSLGAPSAESARAGRMNPAGIAYLYTSVQVETALRETDSWKRTSLSVFVAEFKLTEDLVVLDLTESLDLPSIFDLARKQEREDILFLQEFVSNVSQVVERDGSEHIDYVPSQVVCEYMAQVFETESGLRIRGILFPSAVHPGGKNLVVFPSDRGVDQAFDGVEYVGYRKKGSRR